jgi:glucosamine--fructose-6-phosphate aminotransferase (isomerizing)
MAPPGAQMLAEMREQPRVLASLVERRGEIRSAVGGLGEPAPPGVVLVARGSSDNAAIYGRYLLELVLRRPVALAAPSLFTVYGARVACDGWLAIALSQSGRTPEIVDVFERLIAAGARGIAITNDPAAPLAQAAAAGVALGAGEELAVPATKTFVAQLAAFALVAEALADVPWAPADLDALAGHVGAVLDDPEPARLAAAVVGDAPALVALGRGFQFSVALEAALKLKETALLLAEGMSSADFLHGPIAVMAHAFPALSISDGGAAAAGMAELERDLAKRAGPLIRLAPDPGAELPIPAEIPEALAPIVSVVRAQQLARETAIARGLDPDAPPGLSKVTMTR